MVEVLATEDYAVWFAALPTKQALRVGVVVGLLKEKGVELPFPYSSAIQGSALALRELRVKASGHQLRVLYAFDPDRAAVLLIGGDKTGDDRFYEEQVPRAEKVFTAYLAALAEQKRKEKERKP